MGSTEEDTGMFQGIPEGSGMLQGEQRCSKGHWDVLRDTGILQRDTGKAPKNFRRLRNAPRDSKGLRDAPKGHWECTKESQRAQGCSEGHRDVPKGHWDVLRGTGTFQRDTGMLQRIPRSGIFPRVQRDIPKGH